MVNFNRAMDRQKGGFWASPKKTHVHFLALFGPFSTLGPFFSPKSASNRKTKTSHSENVVTLYTPHPLISLIVHIPNQSRRGPGPTGGRVNKGKSDDFFGSKNWDIITEPAIKTHLPSKNACMTKTVRGVTTSGDTRPKSCNHKKVPLCKQLINIIIIVSC